MVWFEGNDSDYEAYRKMRSGKDADQLHRIKYRSLIVASSASNVSKGSMPAKDEIVVDAGCLSEIGCIT